MTTVRYLRGLFIRVLSLFSRSRAERDRQSEIESNIQLHIDANAHAGMTAEESRRAALVKFGSIDSASEAWRDQKRIPFLEVLMRNVKYALRLLVKSPGFAAAVILVLALSIGGNIAIFSIVNATLI